MELRKIEMISIKIGKLEYNRDASMAMKDATFLKDNVRFSLNKQNKSCF